MKCVHVNDSHEYRGFFAELKRARDANVRFETEVAVVDGDDNGDTDEEECERYIYVIATYSEQVHLWLGRKTRIARQMLVDKIFRDLLKDGSSPVEFELEGARFQLVKSDDHASIHYWLHPARANKKE